MQLVEALEGLRSNRDPEQPRQDQQQRASPLQSFEASDKSTHTEECGNSRDHARRQSEREAQR